MTNIQYLQNSNSENCISIPILEKIYYVIVCLGELGVKLFLWGYLAEVTNNWIFALYLPMAMLFSFCFNFYLLDGEKNGTDINNLKKPQSSKFSYFGNIYRSIFYFRAEPFNYSRIKLRQNIQVQDLSETMYFLFGPSHRGWIYIRIAESILLLIFSIIMGEGKNNNWLVFIACLILFNLVLSLFDELNFRYLHNFQYNKYTDSYALICCCYKTQNINKIQPNNKQQQSLYPQQQQQIQNIQVKI